MRFPSVGVNPFYLDTSPITSNPTDSGKVKKVRGFSPEFLAQQKKNKFGANNPQYGVIKTPETRAKLTKYVYTYDAATGELLFTGGMVETKKYFNMGYDQLNR